MTPAASPAASSAASPAASSAPPALPPVVQDPALVQLGINVIRGLAMDAPEQANSGHSGHGDGAGAVGPRAVDAHHAARPAGVPLARPRPLRAVERACVHPAVLAALPDGVRPLVGRHPPVPPIRAAGRRGIPSASTPTASKSPPDRSARASPTRSAWPSPSGSYGPASGATSATTAPMSSPGTAASWRASPTRRRRSPGTSSWAG